MRNTDFDPLEYIEKAFLDTNPPATRAKEAEEEARDAQIPSIADYLHTKTLSNGVSIPAPIESPTAKSGSRFRKTVMSAPRPRRSKADSSPTAIDPQLQTVWEALPKNIDFLSSFFDDSVTANYYGGEFKETRQDLIRRLLDPELSLEETSRLLGVCPATIRRYTNRAWLSHHRTAGGQRRFRLSDVVKFVELHGRFPED